MLAAFLSAIAAIHVLLRFLRRHRTDVFVAYRVGLAVLVIVVFLGR
jgi:undecaprenyl pyrophosphate phosphatase UppP